MDPKCDYCLENISGADVEDLWMTCYALYRYILCVKSNELDCSLPRSGLNYKSYMFLLNEDVHNDMWFVACITHVLVTFSSPQRYHRKSSLTCFSG